MANEFGKISVGVTASTGGLTRGLNKAKSELTTFGRMNARLGAIQLATGFNAIVTAASLAARAIRQVGDAANFTVQAAAGLVEAQNRVNVVFGGSADAVNRFAKSTSAIGIAESESLQAAGLFGTLFNNIGLAEEQSAQFSMRLVELAADMASFNDVTVEDSLRALRSALVGEVEPIRRLGVVLNDNALRQQAFAMGLTNTTRFVLTPAVKMQAAYASILQQTTVQQGDFARTSGTLTNQQRTLTANIKELSAALGKELIPLFLEVVSGINKSMASIRAFGATLKDFFAEISSGFGMSVSMADVFSGSLRRLGGFLNILRGSWQVLLGVVARFYQATQLLAAAIYNSLAAITGGIETVINGAINLLMSTMNRFFSFVAKGLRAIGVKEIADTLDQMVKERQRKFNVAGGLGKALGQDLFEDATGRAFHNFQQLGDIAAKHFADGVENITNPFADFDRNLLQENMDAAAQAAMNMIPQIGKQVGNAIKAVGDAVTASVEPLKAIVVNSAAGEEFRNAILRGADPRLAQSNDQRIADNTGRTADGVAALPGALAAQLGAQIATASVSV